MTTIRKRIAAAPCTGFLCLLVFFSAVTPAWADSWLPVTPEDLQMKSEPKAPKAPAIYLYRQVDRDDNSSEETVYARIKVLTEEGRQYANVEIPYLKDSESVRELRARTIRPDGTVINFDGTVYEKPIIKARGVKLLAKSFSLPNVEVGSIVEYRYRHILTRGYVFDSHWVLSQDLFTRHAKFSLKPSDFFVLRWSWPIGLPENTEPPKKERGAIRLETHDVPAFVTEQYMPPEDVLKYRVDFIYSSDAGTESDHVKYWKTYGRQTYRTLESFVDDRRAMEQAVAQIVQPGDSPEVQLRKIYSRAQQIRNLSFERKRSEQEEQRENLSDIDDAEEVWKRGYGNGLQITWLFLALARAAGFAADPVLVPTRDLYFFDPRIMNPGQLNSNVGIVKLDDRELFLDPGTPFTPFGMLPWQESAVTGLRVDKSGGSWVTTPHAAPSASRVERKVALRLSPTGTLEGKVTVTYTGLEASWRRLAERNEDDTERRQFLERDIEGDVPSGIEVKLTNTPDWNGSDAPLIAEYDMTVPGWAATAGRRSILPVGLFGGAEKHTFEHAARVHPLYFSFRYQHVDDVTIELPAGWQVSSVPEARAKDLKVATYATSTEAAQGVLHLKRELTINLLFLEMKFYPQLRDFFQIVRAGDEDQIIVSPGAATAQN